MKLGKTEKPMDKINPYESPQVEEPLIPSETQYFAKPPYLWVRDGAVLPQRCVKTNEPVSPEDYRTSKLQWAGPPFQLVLSAKKVRVTWAMSPKLRRKMWMRHIAALLPIVGACAMVFAMQVLEGQRSRVAVGAACWLPLLIVAVVLNRKTQSWPRLKGHQDGFFQFEYCGPEFLNSLPQFEE